MSRSLDVVACIERSLNQAAAAGDFEAAFIAKTIAAARRDETIDLALELGFKSGPGERRLHRQLSFARRDALIRAAALQFMPDESLAAAAEQIRIGLLRYFTAGWKSDRALAEVRPRDVGTLRGRFWAILKEDAAVPSARSIRRILATK